MRVFDGGGKGLGPYRGHFGSSQNGWVFEARPPVPVITDEARCKAGSDNPPQGTKSKACLSAVPPPSSGWPPRQRPRSYIRLSRPAVGLACLGSSSARTVRCLRRSSVPSRVGRSVTMVVNNLVDQRNQGRQPRRVGPCCTLN